MRQLVDISQRSPVVLTNMEHLDGSIQWLSRSATAVFRSQPSQGIRLPRRYFLCLSLGRTIKALGILLSLIVLYYLIFSLITARKRWF